ncbi:uncharacterized protein [Arachis hypogaea]|uniref:uncharacterized protein n=1 Tax=Arachis hypogaea TaxID=3818 RepID=UPI003B222973
MSFGLKNAGATYQRLMDKVFRHQIGRNIEIYVDDMVAKTTQERSHCDDLKEIFEQIRSYNMRLNLEKCAFGVQGGKFLGFMLTSRGIEVNPEKCEAILNMASPKTMKELGSCHRDREDTTASILRQQSHATNGTKVSEDRTASLNTRGHNKKSKALFSKPHNNSKDKPPIKANTDKTRTGRTFDQMAKYEVLIAGLKLALRHQVQNLTSHCDSLLVVQQIRGEFQVKDPLLEQYWLIAKDLISKFSSFIILHVHREKNVRADILSKLAATRADTQTSALSQLTLTKPSIELLYIENINRLHDWRTPFLKYINTGTKPRDELNPQHFRRKASFYTRIAGELYRRGFSQPLLKCLSEDEAKEVMDEVHEGVCGNHIGGRALAAKIA